MINADSTVSYVARQVTTITWGTLLTSEQMVYHSGMNGVRMDYISPYALRGEFLVDDGRKHGHYIPKRNLFKIRRSGFPMMKKLIDVLKSLDSGNLRAELVGTDRVAGRPTFIIAITHTQRSQGRTHKFWVDSANWVSLKTEEIATDRSVVSQSYYKSIQFVSSIPREKFRVVPPPGARVEREPAMEPMSVQKAQRLVAWHIMEPSYIPQGFKVVGAVVRPYHSIQVVSTWYTDGVSSFSLFEAPESPDRHFGDHLHKHHLKDVYTWKVGTMSLTLMGQIPSDEMRRIAGSVR
jgi:negative regulator of sigma E activity